MKQEQVWNMAKRNNKLILVRKEYVDVLDVMFPGIENPTRSEKVAKILEEIMYGKTKKER